MTQEEQILAIRKLGYSRKEADFLVLAALHSGYFLPRQYDPRVKNLASILCQKLIRHGHAKVKPYGRQRVCHLCSQGFFSEIGQEHNRNRTAKDTYRIRGKIMALDYVLAHPTTADQIYLPTEEGKLAYFCDRRNIPLDVLPNKMYDGSINGRTRRYFIDKFPILADQLTNRVTFAFVDNVAFDGVTFRTWLTQHSRLFRELKACDIVYVATSASQFKRNLLEFDNRLNDRRGLAAAALASYLKQRKEMEDRKAVGYTNDEFIAYRKLAKQFPGPDIEARYQTYLQTGIVTPITTDFRMTLYTPPFNYSWLGSFGQDRESA